MDARTISEALGGRRSGKGYIMPCVAHDDKNPSLSVTDTENGKILVHCHAGCTFQEVSVRLKDMGLWYKSNFTSEQKQQYKSDKSRRLLFEILDHELMVYCQALNVQLYEPDKVKGKDYLETNKVRIAKAANRIIIIMGKLHD